MAFEVIRGFSNLNTSKNPKHLEKDQMSVALNMEWISDNEVYVRRGSSLKRDNSNWSGAYVIDGTTFKRRTDSYYFEVYFLSDGRMFYYRSDAGDFADTDATATEITATDGSTSPALDANLTTVSFDGLNNKLFIVDGTQNIYWWDGTDNKLHLVLDPTDFTITYTISTGNATAGAVYSDAADSSRKYLVKTTVSSGTSLEVRQTGGVTRTASSGTLNKDSGTGDATLTFSAVSYSDTYEEYKLYKRRGFVVSNEGNIDVSISRNGTDFTGAGSGRLEIDVIEGLRVSNFIPFKRGGVITTEDTTTEKFSISTLTGYKFFDATVAGSEIGQFKTERESKVHGFVGRSGQEIGNIIIGLTRNGFVGFTGQVSTEFGLTDQGSLSDPIKDQIKNINFAAADQITSVIDTTNQRYICAVPVNGGSNATRLFVYDYGKSSSGVQRWSIWYPAFTNIGGLFNFKNNVTVSDTSGNVYTMTVDDVYTDNSVGYTARFESAAFGAGTSAMDVDYKSIWLDLKVPSTEQEITLYSKLDGQLIARNPLGNAIKKSKLTPRKNAGNLIGDFTFIDDETIIGDEFLSDLQIKHSSISGRGQTAVIGVASSASGVNWGVTGLMLELEAAGRASGQK